MSVRNTGLVFPEDLDAWRKWCRHRNRLRFGLSSAKALLRRGTPSAPPMLYLPAGTPTVLVVLDQLSASCRCATVDPLSHLDPNQTAVLSAFPEARRYAPGRVRVMEWHPSAPLPSSVEQVLTLGAFNPLSADVRPWAARRHARFCVIQHGLLTPWAPPLSPGDHLFAWSQADAEYQCAGRSDVTSEVVGSQMLWKASRLPKVQVLDETPMMLGQLHGSELGRVSKQRVYTEFCTSTGAVYRPHPNEADAISRAQHQVMRRCGVQIEKSGKPLVEEGRPIVSIFSTGTLEAASRGIPAWVHHPAPPSWVREFWDRYHLSRWGDAPTAAATQQGEEPAAVVARQLMQ